MRSAMRTVEKRCEMRTAILSAGQIGEAQEDFVFGARVERCGWLVEDQYLRVAHVGAGQGDLLPLAGGEIDAAVEAPPEHLIEALWQRLDDGVRVCLCRRGRDAVPILELLDASEADVLEDAHVIAHVVLEDDADFAAQILHAVVAQIDSVEQDGACSAGRRAAPAV